MSDDTFHTHATACLQALAQWLEPYDNTGALELEEEEDALTLTLPDGKIYVINIHNAAQEVWLASPISGGHHFRWDGTHWSMRSGQELRALLHMEIEEYIK